MKKEEKLWKTLHSSYAISSNYLKIRRETVQLPTGQIYNDYFINETAGWVAIFCVTHENKIILNRQYKHGIGEYVLELPAGAIDPNEHPEVSARRELLEETGYEARNFEYLGAYIIDPTFSEGYMHLFFCDEAVPTGGKSNDPRENIANRFVSIDELVRLLRSLEINVIGHVAAIYTVLDRKYSLVWRTKR